MSKTQGTQTRHLQAAPNFSIDLNITFGTPLCNVAKSIRTFIAKITGISTGPDTERVHHQNNSAVHGMRSHPSGLRQNS
jgi:hypothetical protein